jgi:hypothetical protein
MKLLARLGTVRQPVLSLLNIQSGPDSVTLYLYIRNLAQALKAPPFDRQPGPDTDIDYLAAGS